jgi:hypothetical protein
VVRESSKSITSPSSSISSQLFAMQDHKIPTLEKNMAMWDNAVSLFNENPEKGVAMLLETKIVQEEKAHDIASFLYVSYGLDPDSLGKFIGKKENDQLLSAFISLNDFRGLSIADAVRHMLRKFKPIGESAIIDRVLTAFSDYWKRDNPNVFSHPDTAYQLAFATLMVNTSLNNPHALDQAPPLVRSASSFQRVIRKELCVNENNLNNSMLEDLYESVRQRPIELVNDKYMTIFRDSVRSGWVEKRTANAMVARKWKRRLLVLSGHKFIGYALYYFKAGKDRAWRMMIPLNADVTCGFLKDDKLCIFIERGDGKILSTAKRNDEGTTEKDNRKRFIFRCSDVREAEYWLDSILKCMNLYCDEKTKIQDDESKQAIQESTH